MLQLAWTLFVQYFYLLSRNLLCPMFSGDIIYLFYRSVYLTKLIESVSYGHIGRVQYVTVFAQGFNVLSIDLILVYKHFIIRFIHKTTYRIIKSASIFIN